MTYKLIVAQLQYCFTPTPTPSPCFVSTSDELHVSWTSSIVFHATGCLALRLVSGDSVHPCNPPYRFGVLPDSSDGKFFVFQTSGVRPVSFQSFAVQTLTSSNRLFVPFRRLQDSVSFGPKTFRGILETNGMDCEGPVSSDPQAAPRDGSRGWGAGRSKCGSGSSMNEHGT